VSRLQARLAAAEDEVMSRERRVQGAEAALERLEAQLAGAHQRGAAMEAVMEEGERRRETDEAVDERARAQEAEARADQVKRTPSTGAEAYLVMLKGRIHTPF
jgi:chromosome segregation ATPase